VIKLKQTQILRVLLFCFIFLNVF